MATYAVGPGKPYTTIQSAIYDAGFVSDANALIPVDPGTYTENLDVKTWAGGTIVSTPVTIYAADPNNRPVIVSAAGAYCILADAVCSTLANTVTLTNLIWSGGSATTDWCYSNNGVPFTVTGCDFLSLSVTRSIAYQPYRGASSGFRWVFSNCYFQNPPQLVFNSGGGYGLMRNCRIDWRKVGTNMVQSYFADWKFYNNSVASTANGGTLFVTGPAINNAIKVVSSTPAKFFDVTGGYGNNCTSTSLAASGTDLGGNIVGDPGFTDYTTGNFRFTASSPCLNAGTTLADVPTDYLGTARPQSTAYDIGAFELILTADVVSVTVLSDTSIRLNLDASVDSDATWADPANYTITPSGGAAAVTVLSAVASGDPGTYITLTTSEHTDGATYTVAWAGVTSVVSGADVYVASGTAPTISSATLTAAKTLRIVWAEAMTNNAALTNASNYVIAPSVAVSSVTRINATTVNVTLAERLPAASGTVTVNGPQDLALNPAVDEVGAFTSNYLTFTTGAVSNSGRTITVGFNIAPISGADSAADWAVAPVGPGSAVSVTDVALASTTAVLTVWPPVSGGSTISITCPTAASASGVIG